MPLLEVRNLSVRYDKAQILNGVTLSVSPEEWMARSEVTRLHGFRRGAEMLGGLAAPYVTMGAGARGRLLRELPELPVKH